MIRHKQRDLWTVNLTIVGADGQPYGVASVLASEQDACDYVALARSLPTVCDAQYGRLSAGHFAETAH